MSNDDFERFQKLCRSGFDAWRSGHEVRSHDGEQWDEDSRFLEEKLKEIQPVIPPAGTPVDQKLYNEMAHKLAQVEGERNLLQKEVERLNALERDWATFVRNRMEGEPPDG